MPMITLDRAYLPDDSCTLGRWRIGDRFACMTLENPWRGNSQGVSCIPEGIYTLRKRQSPVVERSSGGQFTEGWEVCNVPGRTYIMLHPGNFATDTEGCILPGREIAADGKRFMVTQSRSTFAALMAELSSDDEWTLDIRARTVSYP